MSVAHFLVSCVWSSATQLNRFAYARGWKKQVRLEGPRVISLGNLQAGGAGKTPLVMEIAREAQQKGLQVAVLTRGYGGEWERSGGLLLPGDKEADPLLCGDEAALIHWQCPWVGIGIGKNRAETYERMKRKFSPDLLVLDDGLQHLRVARDVDVAVVTEGAWGASQFFREWPSSLKRVDLVVGTKGAEGPCQVEFDLKVAERPGIRLHGITGIGMPEVFFRSLEKAGYLVSRKSAFPDHYAFSLKEIQNWMEQAQASGEELAITGKDWVKWKALLPQLQIGKHLQVFEPQLRWVKGQKLWQQAIWGDGR